MSSKMALKLRVTFSFRGTSDLRYPSLSAYSDTWTNEQLFLT